MWKGKSAIAAAVFHGQTFYNFWTSKIVYVYALHKHWSAGFEALKLWTITAGFLRLHTYVEAIKSWSFKIMLGKKNRGLWVFSVLTLWQWTLSIMASKGQHLEVGLLLFLLIFSASFSVAFQMFKKRLIPASAWTETGPRLVGVASGQNK